MSFSGIGLPFCFNERRTSAYVRAVADVTSTTRALPINRSTRETFSAGRCEFSAPKSNSPNTGAGRQSVGNCASH
jgi:hypothetical protein